MPGPVLDGNSISEFYVPDDVVFLQWMGRQLLGHRLRRNRPCTYRSHCLRPKRQHPRHTWWIISLVPFTSNKSCKRSDRKQNTSNWEVCWEIHVRLSCMGMSITVTFIELKGKCFGWESFRHESLKVSLKCTHSLSFSLKLMEMV